MSQNGGLSGPIEIEDNEKVLLGKNGFLFQRYDQAFEQLCGHSTLRADQIARWTALIESRHAWCRARNIPYIFAVTPEKHAAYPDFLPEGYELNVHRPVKEIFKALLPSVRSTCVYYDDVLYNGRSLGDTFYRTDIHWTTLGACLAYNEIANISNELIPALEIPTLEAYERRFTGEFSFHLKERVSESAVFFKYKPPRKSRKVLANRSFKQGQVEVFETDEAPERTLLFLRDSNGTALLPYILPHFSRVIVVATTRMFYEVVQSESCTLVITQMAERYMARIDESGVIKAFPDDFGEAGFTAATATSIPLSLTRHDLAIDFRVGGNADAFLGSGWSDPETNHRWAIGEQSFVNIPARACQGPSTIEFCVSPFTDRRSHPEQRARILLNDIEVYSNSIKSTETITLITPPELWNKPIVLTIIAPDAIAPRDVCDSTEGRVVSFAFDFLWIRVENQKQL